MREKINFQQNLYPAQIVSKQGLSGVIHYIVVESKYNHKNTESAH